MSEVVPEPETEEPAAVDVVDDGVWEGLGRLLALAPAPPRWLRLQVGDTRIDMGWSGDGPGGAPGPVGSSGGQSTGPSSSADDTDSPDGHQVGAPTVGVFYRAPEPGAQPFVAVGDSVSSGQQLGIIEAMKTMIPVRSDRAGTVAAVLIEDGTGVEYAEGLFVLT